MCHLSNSVGSPALCLETSRVTGVQLAYELVRGRFGDSFLHLAEEAILLGKSSYFGFRLF